MLQPLNTFLFLIIRNCVKLTSVVTVNSSALYCGLVLFSNTGSKMIIIIISTLKDGGGAEGVVGGLVLVLRLVEDALEDVLVVSIGLLVGGDVPVMTVTVAVVSVAVDVLTSIVVGAGVEADGVAVVGETVVVVGAGVEADGVAVVGETVVVVGAGVEADGVAVVGETVVVVGAGVEADGVAVVGETVVVVRGWS